MLLQQRLHLVYIVLGKYRMQYDPLLLQATMLCCIAVPAGILYMTR